MVLGVADRSPRRVIGTNSCPDAMGQAQKLFETLGFRIDIEEVRHPDGRVVVFEIPSRPRGTAYHYEGAYLMRSGASLVPMSEARLGRGTCEIVPQGARANRVVGYAVLF
jgi:ATP-dependent DNA helicase RecG